jgi:hypothetical protein
MQALTKVLAATILAVSLVVAGGCTETQQTTMKGGMVGAVGGVVLEAIGGNAALGMTVGEWLAWAQVTSTARTRKPPSSTGLVYPTEFLSKLRQPFCPEREYNRRKYEGPPLGDTNSPIVILAAMGRPGWGSLTIDLGGEPDPPHS